MGQKDPRIDAYIAKSQDFAVPILEHIRKLVHDVVPDIEESMKWSFPHFGKDGMLCSMAAFKKHCAFGFWKWALIVEGKNAVELESAMGQFGRITALSDLPTDKELRWYIKKAVELNEKGVKLPSKPRAKKAKLLKAPDFFLSALRKNKKALAHYEAFAPSKKNEYIEWITEAKSDDTRTRRLEQAVDWMAEGKVRNWKYEKC